MYTESKFSGRAQYFQAVALAAEPSFASQCIKCGKCEKHCPQGIPIREKIQEAERALLPWPIKTIVKIGRKVMLK
jgi:predicted aldo/keto reductase-like oxidoreductase